MEDGKKEPESKAGMENMRGRQERKVWKKNMNERHGRKSETEGGKKPERKAETEGGKKPERKAEMEGRKRHFENNTEQNNK